MKFPMPGRVTNIHGNLTEVRTCYMNVLWKAVQCEDVYLVAMMIQIEPIDIDPEKVEEDIGTGRGPKPPRIIGSDFLASPTEELEAFFINPSDPTQMLQVGQKLNERIKEELKQFLRENADVFT
ncbi:Uncharacterized protein Adt_14533 [Abeliophyllum distichum]|uniref:Uncharacterized protein n=1 Tax=Abeliophyllum distichum TaxID=126358 RepID=A0ABD1TZY6_9LAMI